MTETTMQYYSYADGSAYPCRLDESLLTPPDMATIDDVWSEREANEPERNFFRWLFNFRKSSEC